MRASNRRSFLALLAAGAILFPSVGAVTPGQARGGGPISGGQIALSGGLDVGGGPQGPKPAPSSTPSTSEPVSHHRSGRNGTRDRLKPRSSF